MGIVGGGQQLFQHFQPARRVGMPAANFLLICFAGGTLGEEIGWRSYFLSRVTTRLDGRWASLLTALHTRWGWCLASLFLGVVWAVWHLPLFYSASTVQSHLPMGL